MIINFRYLPVGEGNELILSVGRKSDGTTFQIPLYRLNNKKVQFDIDLNTLVLYTTPTLGAVIESPMLMDPNPSQGTGGLYHAVIILL